jgi:hypothetical protein
MKNKVVLPLLAAGMIGAAAVTACGAPPPDKGYVYSINYDPPSSVYIPGYYSPGSCSGSGSSRFCSSGFFIPGYSLYFPEDWELELCAKPGAPSKANDCGWRDVDSQTYHTVRLGQFWSAVAS